MIDPIEQGEKIKKSLSNKANVKNADPLKLFKLNVYTNETYMLADILHSKLVDTVSMLSSIGITFHQEDKQNFNEVIRLLNRAKALLRPIFEVPERLENADAFLNESDEMSEIFNLITDRQAVKGTLAYLRHRKSKLHFIK